MCSVIAKQAAALLNKWMKTRPAPASLISASFRTAFARLVVDNTSGSSTTGLQLADVQAVLAGASGLAIGQAAASGPGRAVRALAKACQEQQAVNFQLAPRGQALLLIQAHPSAEPDMDELTDLLEYLEQYIGSQWEVSFNYTSVPNYPVKLRVSLLLAALPS